MRTGTEHRARVHLSAALEPGQPAVLAAVDEQGAEQVVRLLLSGDPGLDPDGRRGRRLRTTDPDEIMATARSAGIGFVTPDSRTWPGTIDALAAVVRERQGGRPLGLWLRGDVDLLGATRSAAVVGSRAATAYGVSVASDFSAVLAEAGVVVVSGAAYGIDAAAHRGALAVGGPTVAVLAGGLDQPYPRGNTVLIDRIAARGLLVSEAAPGSSVNRGRFLSRNRLIAALAAGTIVVEAGARSGALSTARWALELLRPVGAVPGPVTSAMSLGPHQLVREYDATLLSRPAEAVEMVGSLGADAAALPTTAPKVTDNLPEGSAVVHEAMPSRGPVTVAELMASTGLSLSMVLRALVDLAGRELAQGGGETWSRLSPRRTDA